MRQGEFSLIEQYFSKQAKSYSHPGIILGIGDDAAVLKVPEFHQLVVTMDTLVGGRHFPSATPAQEIAYKSLAVNVSDLAAMAASPFYFVLSLTLPEVDDMFLHNFSEGLFTAASEFNIALVGGDTCKGPLSITIQASGLVPESAYVTRSGAQSSDRVFVSGELGNAALGLACLEDESEFEADLRQHYIDALNHPRPRIDMIPILREFATSAIDVSDGLVADLGHILENSGVGARLEKNKIPVCDWIRASERYQYALAGGDDYELVFTVPEDKVEKMLSRAQQAGIIITEIGQVLEVGEGFKLRDQHGLIDMNNYRGFDHFDCD